MSTSPQSSQDYDQVFRELFTQYAPDIYRIVLAAVSYDDLLAQRLLHNIFVEVHKYIHTVVTQQQSIRLYLLALTVTELTQLDNVVPSTHALIPRHVKHKLTPDELQLWQVLHSLPRLEWLVYELWYGEKLTLPELSLVLQKSLSEMQQLQRQAIQRLQSAVPQFQIQLAPLFKKRNELIQLSSSQQQHLLRQLLTKRKVAPTFIEYPWWHRFLRPVPLTMSLGVVALAAVGVLAYYYFPLTWQDRVSPVVQQTNYLLDAIEPLYISTTRPRTVTPEVTLPTVSGSKTLLAETTETLYGTNYVAERTIPNDDAVLTPTVTVEIDPAEYVPVTQTYVYAVPQSVDEDQLQYAALRHFSSLPLNQFQYVNGTYYIGDDASVYQPLFIAFNNNGSIDFQMRQAAICSLPTLTKVVNDQEAELAGFDFLTAHHFVEVSLKELTTQLTSTPNRTVAKDAFCHDGDQALVQDREYIYYPGHTVFQYGNGVTDFLPMRVRGIAVQLHGPNVTNMRVDKLLLLQQYVVRTHQVELMSLTEAITAVQQFVYPAAADRASAERNQKVFMQWNHSYGNDRLASLTLASVRLEYVFDEFNYVIEPYYVFSGQGQDLEDKTVDVRVYVIASTESRDLRSPYRE